MGNVELGPLDDPEPAGHLMPIETGGPETRLTGPPGSPQMGLHRSPRLLPASLSSWPPTL